MSRGRSVIQAWVSVPISGGFPLDIVILAALPSPHGGT
jgi:hypothetical protein